MILTIQIDSWKYKEKPTVGENRRIRKRLKERQITTEELRRALLRGQTVQPAIMDASGNFIRQQVFMVDVDEGRSVKDSIEVCRREKIVPMMIYRTFSGSSTEQRHRLVFVLTEPVEDAKQRDAIQEALIRLFAGDPKTKDRRRLFFGGTMAYNYMGGVIPQSKINALLEQTNKGGDKECIMK